MLKKLSLFLFYIFYLNNTIPFLFIAYFDSDAKNVELRFSDSLRMMDAFTIILFLLALTKFFKIKKKINVVDILYLSFILYLILEIIRNINIYGINSFGEFRYTYLILLLPFSIFYLIDYSKILSLIKSITFIYLIISIFFYFFVSVNLKIGIIGPLLVDKFRVYHKDIVLGILLCSVVLFVFWKNNIVKTNRLFIIILLFLGIIIIFLENHRSVWLCSILSFFILVYYKQVKFSARILYFIIFFILIGVALNYIKDIIPILNTRLLAFTNPETDNTANWRLINWEIQLIRFFNNPLFGEGFGAYWGYTEQKGDIGIMPHNIFVMLLAKTGLIGTFLFVYLLKSIIQYANYLYKTTKDKNTKAIGVITVIITFSIISYGLAYPLDYRITFFLLGLTYSYLYHENIYSNSRLQ